MAKNEKFENYGIAPQSCGAKARSSAFARRVSGASVALGTAREALGAFDRGSHDFGLTKGQFSMIDIAAAALEKTGPATVTVWTWCIAEYEVEAFSAFFNDRRVEKLRVIMDWAGAQRDMPLTVELQEVFGMDCLRVTKTHAKIVTIQNESGWRIVIRGSMNLNENPRFEQFDISDDPAIFDTVAGVEAELWARGKPLPVKSFRHAEKDALFESAGGKSMRVTWGADNDTSWF